MTHLERLLDDLCVDLGFCLRPEQRDRVQRLPTGDADAFTAELFAAEGLSEPYDRRLWRDVREHVARHFDGRAIG